MALGAVGIQVGAGAFLERGREIGEGGKLLKVGDGRLVKCRIEQAELVQSAQLVIGHAGRRIRLAAIQLPGIDPQHVIRRSGVALEAVSRAGIIPGLGLNPGGVGDENGFVEAARITS